VEFVALIGFPEINKNQSPENCIKPIETRIDNEKINMKFSFLKDWRINRKVK
jgi:hypothetical protein